MPEWIAKLLDTERSAERLGLIVERLSDGTVVANVRLLGVHGRSFECGYVGGGPAELAISALNAFFPAQKPTVLDMLLGEASGDEVVQREDSAGAEVLLGWDKIRVASLAWRLHHEFENCFLATMPEDGGYVPAEVIREWLRERSKQGATK